MKKKISFILFSLFSITFYGQCAMCKAVVENSGNEKAAEGLNTGIMWLMVFPYLLVGGLLYAFYKYRKNQKN